MNSIFERCCELLVKLSRERERYGKHTMILKIERRNIGITTWRSLSKLFIVYRTIGRSEEEITHRPNIFDRYLPRFFLSFFSTDISQLFRAFLGRDWRKILESSRCFSSFLRKAIQTIRACVSFSRYFYVPKVFLLPTALGHLFTYNVAHSSCPSEAYVDVQRAVREYNT